LASVYLTFLAGMLLANLYSQPHIMLCRFFFICLVITVNNSCHKDPSSSSNNPPPDDTSNTSPVEITSKILADGLHFPWEILWGPDGMIWMTERSGKLSRVDPATGQVTLLADIDGVVPNNEGGLLGMVLHPEFDKSPYVYIAYDYQKSNDYFGKIVRFTYNNGTLSSPLTIVDDLDASGIHNGCRLVISKDNKLFITTGDASDQSHPQDPDSRNGKILRVNLDGTIPADNPIASSAVWSLGHRNAQGLVMVDDSLFSSEHGPDTDDEVNIIHKGSNYGWPDVRGKCENDEEKFCNEHKVVEPIINWTPTIAVCGLDYYTKDLIPQWKNSLLLCTLKGSRLVQLELNDEHTSVKATKDFFADQYGRLRDLCISPDGRVFLCTSNGDHGDKIIEIGKKVE
jgi:aldose sugar dehydrogenase